VRSGADFVSARSLGWLVILVKRKDQLKRLQCSALSASGGIIQLKKTEETLLKNLR